MYVTVRHYSLVPVRYNEQQLLTRCEPIDAELWSIQWCSSIRSPFAPLYRVEGSDLHWFADVAPLERDNAAAIVAWLNNREAFAATLPPLVDTVVDIIRPLRSK